MAGNRQLSDDLYSRACIKSIDDTEGDEADFMYVGIVAASRYDHPGEALRTTGKNEDFCNYYVEQRI